jgi:hypothetical protein
VEASSTVCDLELDRGAALTVELEDPDGKPLEHCKVTGRAGTSSYDRANDAGPRVEVIGLGPDERRVLRVHHEGRDLGVAAIVSLNDDAEKRRLKLLPCATISGRLLDQGGAPIADTTVRLMTGLEFLWGQRENNDENDEADTRLQLSFKYNFSGTLYGPGK